MRGPSPTPTALKELNGNPGKRPLNQNEPKPKPVAPSMPRGLLSSAAQRFWREYVAKLEKLGVMTEVDGAAFALAAMHWALAAEAYQVVCREGLTRKDENGVERKHPMLQIFRDNSAAFNRMAGQFGLTPAARTRMAVAEPEDGDDFLGY